MSCIAVRIRPDGGRWTPGTAVKPLFQSTRRSCGQSSGPKVAFRQRAGRDSNLLNHVLETGSRAYLQAAASRASRVESPRKDACLFLVRLWTLVTWLSAFKRTDEVVARGFFGALPLSYGASSTSSAGGTRTHDLPIMSGWTPAGQSIRVSCKQAPTKCGGDNAPCGTPNQGDVVPTGS